jgi:hypothetical protein
VLKIIKFKNFFQAEKFKIHTKLEQGKIRYGSFSLENLQKFSLWFPKNKTTIKRNHNKNFEMCEFDENFHLGIGLSGV